MTSSSVAVLESGAWSKVKLRNAGDLLAAVPYMFGFHPADSVVAVGLTGKQVAFQVRADLPGADQDPDPIGEHLAELVAAQKAGAAFVIGYGEAARAEPVLGALAAALRQRDIDIVDVIRAEGERYWSLSCTNASCCPPAGKRYDPSASEFAAAAVVAGLVALPDRAELVKRFAAPTGLAAVEAEQAAVRAGARLEALLSGSDSEVAAVAAIDAAVVAGLGATLDVDQAAWLDALVSVVPLRDRAWSRIRGDHGELGRHLDLWAQVTHRSGAYFGAGAATLAAYAAWRAGDGAQAHIALDRAYDADPLYSLADLIRQALARGLKASTIDLDRAFDAGAHASGAPAARKSGRSPAKRRRRKRK